MTALVLPGAQRVGPCRLAFENLLELGSVAVSSEDPDFPGANAYDWLTSDFWRPLGPGTHYLTLTLTKGLPADYFAFYSQDLWLNGGSVGLQYWNGSSWLDACPSVMPTDNAPRVLFFDEVAASMWRVAVTSPVTFNLGVVSFGRHLALPYGMYIGWTPPALARSTGLTNSISDSGAFLGRSIISKGVRTSLVLQFAGDAWVRENWPAFVLHAERKPFFLVPNADKYPDDAVLCWAAGDITPPTHTNYGFMGTSIPVEGLVE